MTDLAIKVSSGSDVREVPKVSGAPLFLALLAVSTALPWLALPYIARSPAHGGLTNGAKTLLVFLGSGVHVAASYAFYFDRDLRATLRRHYRRYLVAPAVAVVGTGALLAVA